MKNFIDEFITWLGDDRYFEATNPIFSGSSKAYGCLPCLIDGRVRSACGGCSSTDTSSSPALYRTATTSLSGLRIPSSSVSTARYHGTTMSAPIVPEPAEKMNYNTFDGLETGHKSAEAIRKSLAHIGQLQGNEDILPEHEENLKVFERMYQFERIKRPYHLGHLLLLLYVPVGIMLLILRLSILFTTALIVPNLFSENQIDRFGIHKAYCLVTGTIVRVNNKERLSENNPPPIIVANHISEFDAVALRWLCPSYVLGYDFYKKMLFFRLLKDKFGLVYVPYGSRTQGNGQARDELREVIVERLNRGDKPLMCFPEGGLTNGRLGLLQYHKFLFSLGKEIQPLAIRVTDGPFPVNINDETSTFVANVLWYFFIPWHVYTITVMPRTHAEPDEDALAFAQRVMKDTARLLDQQATAFLYRDKITFTRYKNKVLKGGKRDK